MTSSMTDTTTASMEIVTTPAPPGRRIHLEPAAPGLWLVLLGVGGAGIAPLFGFLAGVMVGPNYDAPLPPLYGGLLFGFLIAGIGLLMAAVGGVRLYRHYTANPRPAETDGSERD